MTRVQQTYARLLVLATMALASFGLVQFLFNEGEKELPSIVSPGGTHPKTIAKTAQLSVFARSQGQNDVPSFTDLRARSLAAANLQPGENPTQARRINGSSGPLFVWPMKRGVCFSFDGGAGCEPISVLRERGGIVSFYFGPSLARDSMRIAGVMQDGISEVKVQRRSGSAVRAPVSSNAFVIDVGGSPRRVVWRQGGRLRSQFIPNLSAAAADEHGAGGQAP